MKLLNLYDNVIIFLFLLLCTKEEWIEKLVETKNTSTQTKKIWVILKTKTQALQPIYHLKMFQILFIFYFCFCFTFSIYTNFLSTVVFMARKRKEKNNLKVIGSRHVVFRTPRRSANVLEQRTPKRMFYRNNCQNFH